MVQRKQPLNIGVQQMTKLLVVDGRQGDVITSGELTGDHETARLLGESAVSGRVWYTGQELGEHILEKLTEAGFIIIKVLR